MSRRPKFRPEITRVKLNPEQAVLSCQCYTGVGFIVEGVFALSSLRTLCQGDLLIKGKYGVDTAARGDYGESTFSGFASS